MKEYLTQRVRIVLTMLIALCLPSCASLDEIAEGSLEVAKQRYSGSSYDSDEASDTGIGFNVAYLLFRPVYGENSTTFLQPGDRDGKYLLAYATEPKTFRAGGEKYYHWPSATHLTSESEFLNHLGVMSGLEFIQKNSKVEDTKIKLSYFQVPILALYTHDLSDNRKVFGGLGPYLAYGIGGKVTGDGFSDKAFDKDLGFQRFDAGLTFTAGFKFHKNWSVRLAYDLGLSNIEQESFDKTKNRAFSLNIGYWPHWIQKLTGK